MNTADLPERQSPRTITDTVAGLGPEADLLANNTGTGAVGPFLGRPLPPNLPSAEVNTAALNGLTHLLGTGTVEHGRRDTINVASTTAFQPMPNQTSYATTKAFVPSFTEALAEKARDTGKPVMAAHPGPTDTEFINSTNPSKDPKSTNPPPVPQAEHSTTPRAADPHLLPHTAATRVRSQCARSMSSTVSSVA